jgi:hypothetical protein
VEGPCEHGNEPSGSIKCWEILEWLRKLVASQEGLNSMELVNEPPDSIQCGYVLGQPTHSQYPKMTLLHGVCQLVIRNDIYNFPSGCFIIRLL